jgi:hypothetical protein
MKLIVWKTFDLMRRYAPIIKKDISYTDMRNICDCVADRRLDSIRGLVFTDVLFVGYKNMLEVIDACPAEILSSIITVPNHKRHYCMPSEPQKGPSKPSHTMTISNGPSIDFEVLQPGSETDRRVDAMRHSNTNMPKNVIYHEVEEYEDLPESIRLSMTLGVPVRRVAISNLEEDELRVVGLP